MSSEPFWTNRPCVLFNCKIIPTQDMTQSERLNALTRLLILVTAGLYLYGSSMYLAVGILGLLVIFALQTPLENREGFGPHRGVHDPCRTCGFDSSMAYINTKYETSPANQFSHINDGLRSYTNAKYKVIPVDTPAPYREVWRNEPKFCSEFTQEPRSYSIIPSPGTTQQAYRYLQDNFNYPANRCQGQDTAWVENTTANKCDNRKHSAMPAVQSAFMRDSLEFRNNIMGDYIDQIGRTRQHNCVDFKPGRKTW